MVIETNLEILKRNLKMKTNLNTTAVEIPETVENISELETLGYKVKETISNGSVELTIMVKKGSPKLKLRKVEKFVTNKLNFTFDESYFEIF